MDHLELSESELAAIAPRLLGTGTGGLGWWRVRDSELRETPTAVELQHAYYLQTLMTARHEGQIADVVERLRAAGVAALLGKGWAAARLYPDRGLRPYGDIDLCVRPADQAAAKDAIFHRGSRPAPVDLHPGFADLDDRSLEELFRRSQAMPLDGVAVPVLGPEDHLRLLCLHFFRHHVERPLWLCDISAALESLPPGFDWDYCLSGNRRRTERVACALGLAHRLLSARAAGSPVAEMADRLPDWLVPAVLEKWEGRAPYAPLSAILRRPRSALDELGRRWPNPIDASLRRRGPFNHLPRFPFQLADFAVRFGLAFPARLAQAVGEAIRPGGT